MQLNYSEDIPDYGDLMDVAEFQEACRLHYFIDYDGYGHPAKNGKMDGRANIFPSKYFELPEDATHVVWFNR
ncbi:hypothetical protein C4588_01670 [Candidatus Parcubacteria bacterium]|nr:MAG: hypothetical protein C4588_01670 [Candidatus Parcubacteria bacterium]